MDYNNLRLSDWLPTTNKECKIREWEELDVILFSGDAYVDHPSFGCAVIGRIIESEGLKVAIVPQPNWRDNLQDFKKLGKPRLFFGVTGGCMDPMVNHYTAGKRKRSTDAYTPGGEAGYRPDYATTVYTNILKDLFPDTPVLIGGIEASLRRVTHYDYWQNKLLPSILKTSNADLLVYGMGEQPLREIIKLLKKGVPFSQLTTVKQTGIIANKVPKVKSWVDVEINSHEKCLEEKISYASNFKIIEQESNKINARRIIQKIEDEFLVINPPYPTMTEAEMDTSFDLPYTRMPHPKYKNRGPIPAYEMIRHSVNMHRGCFGGCSFCTISAHQGKFIASRSEESILREVDQVIKMPDYKGYISDLGGPSANMYKLKGKVQEICDRCVSPSCIHPVVCSNLDTNHSAMTNLLKKIDAKPEVKKAFVGSGIRYDLLTPSYNKEGDDSLEEYMEQVIKHHISGRLKVAPEHTADNTLKIMRKPSFKHFKAFKEKYDELNEKNGLNQPLIPYFISSHPGTMKEDMAELAAETKALGFELEQVQDFTPTPMTVATVIYYSGIHPYTLKPTHTAITSDEKREQNIFFFWHKKENLGKISKELDKMGRKDLKATLIGDATMESGKKPKPTWLENRRKQDSRKKKRS